MGKTIIFQSTTMSALKWKLCGIKHTIRLYATISYFLRSLPLFHSNIDLIILSDTAPKIKFSIKDFFGKCDQICSFLWIWPHLLKKSLMENLIFCAVWLFPTISSEFNYFIYFTRPFQLILIDARESLFQMSASF